MISLTHDPVTFEHFPGMKQVASIQLVEISFALPILATEGEVPKMVGFSVRLGGPPRSYCWGSTLGKSSLAMVVDFFDTNNPMTWKTSPCGCFSTWGITKSSNSHLKSEKTTITLVFPILINHHVVLDV